MNNTKIAVLIAVAVIAALMFVWHAGFGPVADISTMTDPVVTTDHDGSGSTTEAEAVADVDTESGDAGSVATDESDADASAVDYGIPGLEVPLLSVGMTKTTVQMLWGEAGQIQEYPEEQAEARGYVEVWSYTNPIRRVAFSVEGLVVDWITAY